MSFRYKSALLSLVSLVAAYGWYFGAILAGPPGGVAQVVRLAGAIVVIVVVQIVGTIAIAVTSRDRYGAMDERERGFDRRATAVGYYLLLIGALGAAASMHLGASRPDMANLIVLAIVIAEAVRQAVFLILHHRAA